MLQSHPDRGSSKPRGASANGVDDHHYGPFRVADDVIDFFWSASFFDAKAREVFTHWFDEHFWIWHAAEFSIGPICCRRGL